LLGRSVPLPVQLPSNSWNGPSSARADGTGLMTIETRSRIPAIKAAGEKGANERNGIFPYKFELIGEQKHRPPSPRAGCVWFPLSMCSWLQFSLVRFYHKFMGYFLSPGRKTLNGRLIVPLHERVMVLPPSVQVCVPLRSA
jgi:hypothetical protein